MSFTKFLVIIISLFLTISVSCQSQTKQDKPTAEKTVVNRKSNKTYNPKDLKILSEFIDTTKLFHYQKQIINFQKDDSLHPNRALEIIFTGSSSIRKWSTLKEDFKGYSILNRGFGGSTVPEAIYYSDVLFLKHNPQKIIFYSGDNDIAFYRSSTEKIIKSYKYLIDIIKTKLPDTDIYILSIKPSPARWKYWPQMQEINEQLKPLCAEKKCKYINVSSCLLNANGEAKKELFAKDGVHMNKNGYALWTDIINEAIK